MSYVLKFPFQLHSTVIDFDESSVFALGSLTARLILRNRYVVLEVRGFDSQDHASAYIPNVWAALRWVLIESGINTTFDLGPNDIAWAEDPLLAAKNLSKSFDLPDTAPVHGIASTDGSPMVYREDQNVRVISFLGAVGTSHTPKHIFLEPFSEALSRLEAYALIKNSRFKLASDLYSAFYLETSPTSKLITLGMVLEVIADPANKHQASIDLIDDWREELTQRKLMFIDDQDAIHSLESLDRELLVRKEASVRSRIRHTAKRLSVYLASDEMKNLDRDAVNTYDERSALVHKGQISKGNIGELVDKGQRAVKLLLKAYYTEVLQVSANTSVEESKC